ncbi:DNA replication/repair protein RecF [Hyphomicrobium sp.]|jgi:DNA replication and repair protein RecF|uniref:DNA replication/repair protein RecF n=1 Tax=Hyphomicrobium sp. TaxID=82 RepID=UPI002C85E645|nr:DNA replication/repair protein RecF [Hyphomicrobium sp.]HVZ05879.1 DNA replication/repair protein RecF [Hyphomicrobium sp.]
MTLWVERLGLTNFRSYAAATVVTDAGPQVIVGANGSGKTNLLEAISLLSPGQGLRRVPFGDLARAGGDGGFAVAARAHTLAGPADIGTGLQARAPTPSFTPTPSPSPQGGGEFLGGSGSQNGGDVSQRGSESQQRGFSGSSERSERTGRIVRIDGVAQSGSGVLADYLEIVWVMPAMDGLFTGAASERRRFLDRLILCFDHSYRTIAGRFERAMTSRNRLLADGVRDNAQLSGFEQVMAENGIAVAAARLEAVAAMAAIVAHRRERNPNSAFPWSSFRLEGSIEESLQRLSAVEAEDVYAQTLRETRERDRAASRTLDGPHRSDLIVEHGPKALAARQCSTGEQKALLLGLVLAHAELLTERQEGAAPILLLDEITAHLDADRRAALFEEILRLGAQAWMTGTDANAFEALSQRARFWAVEEGEITVLK